MEVPRLFVDHGCPFAHRVFALLDHLRVEHVVHDAPVGQLPAELAAFSSSKRLPLLAHGAVVIGESRVMLEHVAESYAYAAAYPTELAKRSLHRYAMALFDSVLVPRLFADDPSMPMPHLEPSLDVLESVAVDAPTADLLTFHVAPLWLRFEWWRPRGTISRAIRSRRGLAAWLDAAAALPAVVRTSPDRDENVAAFRRAVGDV